MLNDVRNNVLFSCVMPASPILLSHINPILPTEISCGSAGDLPNGNFRYEGQTYVGEKVFAECKKG